MTELNTHATPIDQTTWARREYFYYLANYKFNPNKPGIFQWQSVDDVFLMVVD